MYFSEFKSLMEKRSHAEMNPKENFVQFLIDNMNNNNVYIHFTNINKVGIKPQTEWSTPQGVYAWQLNFYKKRVNAEINKQVVWAQDAVAAKRAEGFSDSQLWKNMTRNMMVVNGDMNGIIANRLFPYMGDALYMFALEAKPGLKWLNLTENRFTWDDYKKGLDILEKYVMNHISSGFTSNMFKEYKRIGSFLTVPPHGTQSTFTDWAYETYGTPLLELIAIEKEIFSDDKPSELFKKWLYRKDFLFNHNLNMKNLPKVKGNLAGVFYLTTKWVIKEVVPSGKKAAIGVAQTAVFRALGYDAVRDNGKGILFDEDEPAQVVFLHPNAYTVKSMVYNYGGDKARRKAKIGGSKQFVV